MSHWLCANTHFAEDEESFSQHISEFLFFPDEKGKKNVLSSSQKNILLIKIFCVLSTLELISLIALQHNVNLKIESFKDRKC